jgi:putative peptidoglycan lipid II flippase
MLYRTLKKRGHFQADAQLKRRIPRLALAAVLMGVGWCSRSTGCSTPGSPAASGCASRAGVLVGRLRAIYGIACFVTRRLSLDRDLKALVRRTLRRG